MVSAPAMSLEEGLKFRTLHNVRTVSTLRSLSSDEINGYVRDAVKDHNSVQRSDKV